MTRLRAFVPLLVALGLMLIGSGCITTHLDTGTNKGGYYRRGSVHYDSFPPDYVPGRHRSWGSYGGYGW